jgi:hypothetical protein
MLKEEKKIDLEKFSDCEREIYLINDKGNVMKFTC